MFELGFVGQRSIQDLNRGNALNLIYTCMNIVDSQGLQNHTASLTNDYCIITFVLAHDLQLPHRKYIRIWNSFCLLEKFKLWLTKWRKSFTYLVEIVYWEWFGIDQSKSGDLRLFMLMLNPTELTLRSIQLDRGDASVIIFAQLKNT